MKKIIFILFFTYLNLMAEKSAFGYTDRLCSNGNYSPYENYENHIKKIYYYFFNKRNNKNKSDVKINLRIDGELYRIYLNNRYDLNSKTNKSIKIFYKIPNSESFTIIDRNIDCFNLNDTLLYGSTRVNYRDDIIDKIVKKIYFRKIPHKI